MQIGGLKLILKNIKKRYLDVSGTFPIISKGMAERCYSVKVGQVNEGVNK